MALLETLTIQLAAPMLKAVAKLWLKDSPIGEGAAGGLIEIFKKKIDGWDAQRGAEKLFDNLQDEIARRLADTIEAEFPQLPESDRTAAALAVAAVFGELDLSVEAFRQDLDPARLLAVRPPARRCPSAVARRRQRAARGVDAARVLRLRRLSRRQAARLPGRRDARTPEAHRPAHERTRRGARHGGPGFAPRQRKGRPRTRRVSRPSIAARWR